MTIIKILLIPRGNNSNLNRQISYWLVYLYPMSEFRTVLSSSEASFTISLTDPCLTVGSCFADHLGLLLQKNKFSVSINPFGTTYNPISIHKVLSYAIDNTMPSPETFGELNETFFNYDFHSSFSSLQKSTLESNLQRSISQCHEFMKSARVLMITYGTSWVYEREDNQEIVSNCHKIPSHHFSKKLLTQKKILESFGDLHKQLQTINPDLRIILTLSPVRHLKDSLELNAVSKSILRLSCHTLSEMYPDTEYFPAYEIVLDDLRDYRFYDRDMLHPSPEAIHYIWKIFCERYFTKDTRDFIRKWKDIMNAIEHRPYQPESISHQKFLKELVSQLEGLKSKVDVDKEIREVSKRLTR